MTDFPRQPQPVIVSFKGEPEDIIEWYRRLKRSAEYKGDLVQENDHISFTIHPRAVND